MAEPLRPAATKTYGRTNWVFVPTIASATLAPTVAEATGASSLDVTNILFADGGFAPTKSSNLVTQPRRLGDVTESQFVGTTTYAGSEVTYQFNPQGAAASDGVKAWEKFLNSAGTVAGYMVRRQGIDNATALAAGQFVDVFPVEIGPSMPGEDGDGESAETAAMATIAVTSEPAFKKAILA
jgi:hypothetical protein